MIRVGEGSRILTGLNRTSVGLKLAKVGEELDREVMASIEPAWD